MRPRTGHTSNVPPALPLSPPVPPRARLLARPPHARSQQCRSLPTPVQRSPRSPRGLAHARYPPCPCPKPQSSPPLPQATTPVTQVCATLQAVLCHRRSPPSQLVSCAASLAFSSAPGHPGSSWRPQPLHLSAQENSAATPSSAPLDKSTFSASHGRHRRQYARQPARRSPHP